MSDQKNAIAVGAIRDVVKEARAELANIKQSLPDPREQPAWYALATEYCASLDAWASDLEVGKDPVDTRWQEIRGWIIDEEEKPDEPFANLLVREGHTWTETKKLLEAADPGRSGRPKERRAAFISAQEMHAKGIPYSGIATSLCDCGKSKHDKFCTENIRKGVQQVNKLLKRIQLDTPRK